MNQLLHKSEILFIYDSLFNIPNGDPFTGEQRYDEDAKRILVSDVRIKRYIRDFLHSLKTETKDGLVNKYEIYVVGDKNLTDQGGEGSQSAQRIAYLKTKYKDDFELYESKAAAKGKAAKKDKNVINSEKLVKKYCIDVRLFGGISTKKEETFNITGPVQFAMLNPSLNEVELRIHQNTTVFSSSNEKKQGSIGTTSLVPYAVNCIHGWINPFVAIESELKEDDIKVMYSALWDSINLINTRSKANQNSILLLEFVYKQPNFKLYGVENTIKLKHSGKSVSALRNVSDYEFDFTEFFASLVSEKIEKVNYYTEISRIDDQFKKIQHSVKFEKMKLDSLI
ncbi:MAG: type I CRISPR-associated protein Cas7 [Ignavibacteriaceae bacterium]|nr:type I CRISPR-associated protein Cas7 [Ignavibacteriaceae bacterium]